MEYNEASDPFSNLEELNAINRIGEKWSRINCDSLHGLDQEKCLKIREITVHYGEDAMKVMEQASSCNSLLEDIPSANSTAYDNCMEGAQQSLNSLVEKYHGQFTNTDSL